MKKIILGFAGEIACGKGTCVKYLAEKYGAVSFRFSDPLRDIAKRLYLDESRENLQNLSTTLRGSFGQDILSKTVFRDAENSKSKVVIIDGIRRKSDIEMFKDAPEFKLVYVDADMRMRFERIIKRGENTDEKGKTFEEFQKDHEQEAEKEIQSLKEIADFVIDNNGGEEELIKNIDGVINQIKS